MPPRIQLRSPWPGPSETLLLRAALDEDGAVAAWRAWRRLEELERIDGASLRLLGLVYRNLRRDGISEAELRRLKDVYRFAWSRNQMLFHHTAEALAALEREGIPTLVLKGAALAVLHYRDLGARPMEDVDVLVPNAQASRALAVLSAARWIPAAPHSPDALLRHHAAELHDRCGRQLDLHWHAQWEAVRDDGIWAKARPLQLSFASTLAPDPADLLLHVCVHGTTANVVSPVRWVADALTLLRDPATAIAWDRVIAQAVWRELTVSTAATFSYLRRAWDAPIRPEVVDERRERRGRANGARAKKAIEPLNISSSARSPWTRSMHDTEQ